MYRLKEAVKVKRHEQDKEVRPSKELRAYLDQIKLAEVAMIEAGDNGAQAKLHKSLQRVVGNLAQWLSSDDEAKAA